MGVYAQQIGVDDSLETGAQWVVWADQAHFTTPFDDNAATYNLQQFWSWKAALDTDTTNANMEDLTYMDALAHRVSGYIYMKAITTADPSDMPGLSAQMTQAFTTSSQEFTACGQDQMAADDAAKAGLSTQWAADTAATWTDTSYLAAVKSTVNSELNGVSSVINAAGSLASMLGNPLVLLGVAALAGFLLIKGLK